MRITITRVGFQRFLCIFQLTFLILKKRGQEKCENPKGYIYTELPNCRAVFSVILGISTNAFILPKLHKQNFRGRKRI